MFGNEEIISLNKLSEDEADKEKTVKIIFKHGGEITVRCENFSLNKYGGSIVEYEISGISGDYPMYIDKEQIAAVLYVREGENKCS